MIKLMIMSTLLFSSCVTIRGQLCCKSQVFIDDAGVASQCMDAGAVEDQDYWYVLETSGSYQYYSKADCTMEPKKEEK